LPIAFAIRWPRFDFPLRSKSRYSADFSAAIPIARGCRAAVYAAAAASEQRVYFLIAAIFRHAAVSRRIFTPPPPIFERRIYAAFRYQLMASSSSFQLPSPALSFRRQRQLHSFRLRRQTPRRRFDSRHYFHFRLPSDFHAATLMLMPICRRHAVA
jgi:hypothetical protein